MTMRLKSMSLPSIRLSSWILLLTTLFSFAALPVSAQLDGAGLAPVPRLDAPVVDLTDTLSVDERSRLEDQSLALEKSSGAQLQILLVPSTQPEDIAVYAQRVFETWKLGRLGVDDGLLIVVAKDDRRVRIHTGTGLEQRISDDTAERLIDEYLTPKFKRGDFAGGLNDATLVLASMMNGEPLPASLVPAEQNSVWSWRSLLAMLFAAMVALFYRLGSESLSRTPSIVVTVIVAAVVGGLVSMNMFVALASILIGVAATFLPGFIMKTLSGTIFEPSLSDPTRAQREAEDNDSWIISSSGGSDSSSGDGWSGGGGDSSGGGASGSW
jgi:uncharacterized protein